MYCIKCKAEVPTGAKFCPACGAEQKTSKPRQKNGSGTYYEMPNGNWQFRVSTGLRGDGSFSRKTFYGKTKKECRQKYDAWKIEGDQKIEKVMMVESWADQWLELYKKGTVSYGTYHNYEMYINNHIKPKLGKFKLSAVRPAHIQQFYKTIADKSKTTQNDIYAALNGIFSTAVLNHLCLENPVSKPVIPKKAKNEIEVFTPDEVKRIVESDSEYAAFPKLLLYTGLRIGEAVALKWAHIDLENGIISVSQAAARKKGGGWIEGDTKSRRNRTVYLTQAGIDFFSGLPRTGLYIFTNARDYPLSPKMYEDRYKKFFADSDVDYRAPHKCRHTYATHLIKGGAELLAVQALLGHTSVKVTEIYTHVSKDNEYLKDNITKLGY